MAHSNCPEKSLHRDGALCEHSSFSHETRQAEACSEHRKWDSAAAALECEAPATRTPHRQGSGEARRRRASAREIRSPPRDVDTTRSLREAGWRRGRDSNPRYGFPYTHFPGVRLRPLGHPSATRLSARVARISPRSARAQVGATFHRGAERDRGVSSTILAVDLLEARFPAGGDVKDGASRRRAAAKVLDGALRSEILFPRGRWRGSSCWRCAGARSRWLRAVVRASLPASPRIAAWTEREGLLKTRPLGSGAGRAACSDSWFASAA